MTYAALEDKYVARTDENDEAIEVAERVRLALDGWSYNADDSMARRLAEGAEFIATSTVTAGTWPGQAEAEFETGDGRKLRITVTVSDDGEFAPVVNAPELTGVLEQAAGRRRRTAMAPVVEYWLDGWQALTEEVEPLPEERPLGRARNVPGR
jgi:hypothetical protein